jgi:hypothetical protein
VKSEAGFKANILRSSTPFFSDHARPITDFFSFQNASSHSSAPDQPRGLVVRVSDY